MRVFLTALLIFILAAAYVFLWALVRVSDDPEPVSADVRGNGRAKGETAPEDGEKL